MTNWTYQSTIAGIDNSAFIEKASIRGLPASPQARLHMPGFNTEVQALRPRPSDKLYLASRM